jgi:PAS domain S-box-containing protein
MSASDNFSTLFELLPIGAYRSDPSGVQVRANRAMVALFGFGSEADMLATATSRDQGWYVLPGRRAEFRDRLLAQGTLRDFVSEMRRPNGETFWISENAHVVRDAQGAVLYHEGTIEDITARVQAERSAAGQRAAARAHRRIADHAGQRRPRHRPH